MLGPESQAHPEPQDGPGRWPAWQPGGLGADGWRMGRARRGQSVGSAPPGHAGPPSRGLERAARRGGGASRARAAALTVRGVERAVGVGAWCPQACGMRRRCTPASRRGVAHAWRPVCPAARWWKPLACSVARKASCTRGRGRGVEAVDIPPPRRPGAGTSPPGWRGVGQSWRSPSSVGWGSGTERSLAPVPLRPWTHRRARSMSGMGQGVPSGRRRPPASIVVRQGRDCGKRTHGRLVRTASRRRRTGSWCSGGGRTQVSGVQSRWRGCSEKHVMPQNAMGLAAREACCACLRERKEVRRAASVIRSGDWWSCAARWRTAWTDISWVRADRPRSGSSSIIR